MVCGVESEEVGLSRSESALISSVLVENAENDSFVSAGANIERTSSILVFFTWTDVGPSNCGRGESKVGFCSTDCFCCVCSASDDDTSDGKAMPSSFAPKFFMIFAKISRSEDVMVDSVAALRASTSRALRWRNVSVVSSSSLGCFDDGVGRVL